MDTLITIINSSAGKSIIAILVTIVIALILKLAKKKIKIDGKLKSFYSIIMDIIMYAVIISAILYIFDQNGLNAGGIIASLGIAGAIAGVALQDMVKDVVMGIHISYDGFYYVGDAVVYDGKECIVTEFNLRSTKLRLLSDGSSIVLCNRLVDQIQRMSNIIDVDVPAPYDVPTSVMRPLCKEIVKCIRELPGVDSATFKGTQEFEESCIRYKLRFMANPSKKWDLIRAVNGIIQDEFDKAGVSIPYNQLDVHVDYLSPRKENSTN